MGFWSSGLYGNDLTSDVRDTYIGFLQEQFSNEEAQEKTLAEYHECIGTDEEPLLWFALAETQWRLGRLTPEIKAKALDWVEADGGLEAWAESSSKGAGWKKTLKKLREKLTSPMPPEKRIRKPKTPNADFWELGDIYAYRFLGNTPESAGFGGKYIAIQKIGADTYSSKQLEMRIQVFDRVFDELPSLEDVCATRILPINYPTIYQYERVRANGYTLSLSTLTRISKKESEYPAEQLTFLGNSPLRRYNNRERYDEIDWDSFEAWVAPLYSAWQGDTYEMNDEGIYQYNGKYRYLEALKFSHDR